ncbi:MAG: TonB-dependent receptor, partial [Bacteroidota bacterium]
VLTELTLADLSTDGHIDEEDFLNRVDIICSLGQNVMISNYIRYYRLVNYISAITRGKKIGIILGVYNLQKVFDETYYQDLKGGVLEAFGTLFGNNVTLYVYPSYRQDSDNLYTLENFQLPENLQGLLDYLRFNHKLVDIEGPTLDHLHIISDNVLAMIKSGEEGWESMVPRKVSVAIKEKSLFGYKL